MISLSNLHLSFGARPILQGASLNIQEGECVAVVGPNGCGKSTLLRVIAGLEHPDKGEVNLPGRATVGYLPQEADLPAGHTLEEELLSAFTEVQAALAEMTVLEEQMGELPPDSVEFERVLRRYSECTHLVEHQDGYALESLVRRVASGLGFRTEDLGRSCQEFSGGWQMRILLAQLLLRKPDVMLLDEPTNHLDLETTLWLEQWIKSCGRTVVLVSHERATMDRLANRIVCMEHGTADTYPGDYSNYIRQSALKREAQWEAFERQRKEIEGIEGFIRRFRYTASRASLVQSRVKQLDKIERLDPPFHPTAIHFRFPPAPPCYRDVLDLRGVGQRYGELQVLEDLNYTIQRGEKIGLVGVNGAGKSTLLRILAGVESPSEGECVLGGKVNLAYFAQYDMSSLNSETSLLLAIEGSAPTGEAGRARDLLGAFLFSGDAVQKPLRVLSGGERTRFRLAQLLFSPANLLLLDEPTNHLDITSRATVEKALHAYTGTVVVVSHDRVFMDRVTDKIIEIDGGAIRVFPGKYSDYLAYKERMLAEAEAAGQPGAGPAGNRNAPTSRPAPAPAAKAVPAAGGGGREQRQQDKEARKTASRQKKTLEKKVEEAERLVGEQEARLEAIDRQMALPEVAADYGRLAPLTEERRTVEARHAALLREWEHLNGELEGLG